jgi:hypothetical protein
MFRDLKKLPSNLHPFKAATHDRLVSLLADQRVLVLKSFQAHAAYSAAYSLVSDHVFDAKKRGLLSPTMEWANNPRELNIVTTAQSRRVGQYVTIVEIELTCSFLDQLWRLGSGQSEDVRQTLMDRDAYLILAVNDDLWRPTHAHPLAPHTISHFSYLLTGADVDDPDGQLATRFERAVRSVKAREEWQEIYAIVAGRLAEGVSPIEAYLAELESRGQAIGPPRRPPPSEVTVELVGENNLAQRTALFVAAFFPDLGEEEFDIMVARLLGPQLRSYSVDRHIVGPDSVPHVVPETREEPWTAYYEREVDDVAHKCRLRPIRREDGRVIVDFEEPHLRRDVREQLRSRHSRFVRRQAHALQQSGLLFSALSEAALEGLLRLFVDRAREDPQASGEAWLAELSGALQARLAGELREGTPSEQLNWLISKALAESELQRFLFGRLALLIRMMLDEEVLRPMVGRIFGSLVSANREEALLKVVQSLIERLRFAPHFDPFAWLRLLLDQSGRNVRGQTELNLLSLAAQRGAKGSEVVDTIRTWLPPSDRLLAQCSPSNQFALTFPHRLTERQDPWARDPARLDPWSQRLALFSSLAADAGDARQEVVALVRWVLDPRALELLRDPQASASAHPVLEAERIADLLEQWARALTGARAEDPTTATTGQALFALVLDAMAEATTASQQLLMRRHWAQQQIAYRTQAVSVEAGSVRASWLRRAAKTADLDARFQAQTMVSRHGRGEQEANRSRSGGLT